MLRLRGAVRAEVEWDIVGRTPMIGELFKWDNKWYRVIQGIWVVVIQNNGRTGYDAGIVLQPCAAPNESEWVK